MASAVAQAPSAPRAMAASPRSRESAGAGSRPPGSEKSMLSCAMFPGAQQVSACGDSSHVLLAGARRKRVAVAPQAVKVGALDRAAQERHVGVDRRLVEARPVEMQLREAVGAVELLADARARPVLVEARGLEDQVLRRAVAHDLAAVGELLARDPAPHELLVQELAHLLEVH